MSEALAMETFAEECAGFTPAHATSAFRILFTVAFPVLDIGFSATGMIPLRLKIDCGKYNSEAPKFALCSLDGDRFKSLPRTGGIFNAKHPRTQFPFICMAGTDEFHTHPSHLSETWGSIRRSRTLSSILYQVQQGWWQQWRE